MHFTWSFDMPGDEFPGLLPVLPFDSYAESEDWAVRKGTGHPTSPVDGSGCALSNRHSPTYESIWDYLYLFN